MPDAVLVLAVRTYLPLVITGLPVRAHLPLVMRPAVMYLPTVSAEP